MFLGILAAHLFAQAATRITAGALFPIDADKKEVSKTRRVASASWNKPKPWYVRMRPKNQAEADARAAAFSEAMKQLPDPNKLIAGMLVVAACMIGLSLLVSPSSNRSNGSPTRAVATYPVGDGRAVNFVWNADGSVDVGNAHYATGREACQTEMPTHMGGTPKAWNQSTYQGRTIPACQLFAGDALWALAFLPGTINHTSTHGIGVTAVGAGQAQVEGITVFTGDHHLDAFSGQWTRGILGGQDSGNANTWVPIGMPTR